jgi:hypothetical protein
MALTLARPAGPPMSRETRTGPGPASVPVSLIYDDAAAALRSGRHGANKRHEETDPGSEADEPEPHTVTLAPARDEP